MQFPASLTHLLLALAEMQMLAASTLPRRAESDCVSKNEPPRGTIAPKVMLVSFFQPEADVWWNNLPSSGHGNLLDQNISLALLSPSPNYSAVHCTASGEICQITTGEAEINAATSISGLLLSSQFDLRSTYFLMCGIAGVNPKLGTLGSVALAKFAVQVALQYELDAREMPQNFTTGYLAYGTNYPDQYPQDSYGTEVMELNEALRDTAYDLATRATLNDSATTNVYRAKYHGDGDMYAAATQSPSVLKCDTATSDVYYSGTLLSEAFENTTRIWTNQTNLTYCMTAQEDNAVLQVLMRAQRAGLADFSRAIVMRTGSNFDRPPSNMSAFDHLRLEHQNGFDISLQNIYLAGIEIVGAIVKDWTEKFADGIHPTNYIGDIFGSLGGVPDFGLGNVPDPVPTSYDESVYGAASCEQTPYLC